MDGWEVDWRVGGKAARGLYDDDERFACMNRGGTLRDVGRLLKQQPDMMDG